MRTTLPDIWIERATATSVAVESMLKFDIFGVVIEKG
jgi:hypothetical protein